MGSVPPLPGAPQSPLAQLIYAWPLRRIVKVFGGTLLGLYVGRVFLERWLPLNPVDGYISNIRFHSRRVSSFTYQPGPLPWPGQPEQTEMELARGRPFHPDAVRAVQFAWSVDPVVTYLRGRAMDFMTLRLKHIADRLDDHGHVIYPHTPPVAAAQQPHNRREMPFNAVERAFWPKNPQPPTPPPKKRKPKPAAPGEGPRL